MSARDHLPALQLPWSEKKLPPTPFYYYSEAALTQLHTGFASAMKKAKADLKLHLAIKANNNPAVMAFFKKRHCGSDIVSGGELTLSLKNGFKASEIIYSGVGKSDAELTLAVQKKIFLINIESAFEIDQLERICKRLKTTASVALRVNPDVDAKTHPYIATGLHEHKFGLSFDEAFPLYQRIAQSPQLKVKGVSMHIGSQLLDLSPVEEALHKVIAFAAELKKVGVPLEFLDVGGGLGISYENPFEIPPYAEYAGIMGRASSAWKKLQGPKASLHSECGRALVGPAGWLITRVIGIKTNPRKSFAVVDASMSELLRPALYGARHPIFKLQQKGTSYRLDPANELQKAFEVVGPVCESSDVLHPEAHLPETLAPGDVLAIGCAGAYGYTMSSFYNVRALPAEYFGQSRGHVLLSRPRRAF